MDAKHPVEEVAVPLRAMLGVVELGIMTQVSRTFEELVTNQTLIARIQNVIQSHNLGGFMQYSERRFTRWKTTEDYAVERKKKLYYLSYVMENCGKLGSWAPLMYYAESFKRVKLPIQVCEDKVSSLDKAVFDSRPHSVRAWSLFSLFVEGCTRELSLKRILVGGQLRDKLGSSVLTVYGPGDLHANHPFAAGYDGTDPRVSVLNADYRGIMDVVVQRLQKKAKAEMVAGEMHLPAPLVANPVEFLRCRALITQAPDQPLWGPTRRLLCDTYTGAHRKRTIALSGHRPGDTFMAFIELDWTVSVTAILYTTEKRRAGQQNHPDGEFPMTVQLVRDALGQQEAWDLLELV
ncbi:unnamed protein product [Vitrella brassicaformis CCMP3155]|uniref:Uncharacterized protein n=1 Tax=Vitrella brassicaformis (strain CCMP3155) TaxID=1169540 RepID=A0A0G4H453_VITBC|nr:unnamed protein product [Vitrella brassicaformis CCMP3155]|eukprot:CEM38529.1 unnamed protein product [Vitrella brassicaformis CCMP3155]